MAYKMKKLRPDSKFAALTEEQRGELNALLNSGEATLADAQEWLRGVGVEVSRQSISEYYRTHVLPHRWERQEQIAAMLDKVGGEKAARAARASMAQRVFDMATDENANPKLLEKFFRLMLAGERLEQDDRKLRLLERRAEQAEQAERVTAATELTAEQKMERIREIFGLNA